MPQFRRLGGTSIAALAACSALALSACGSDDKKDSSKADQPAKTTAKNTEDVAQTTTTPAPDPHAADDLRTAGSSYNTAFDKFKLRIGVDTKANDLDAAKADAAQFRTSVFEYDAAVRKIGVPTDAQASASVLLGKSRTVIADLDAISQAGGIPDYNRIINRFYGDNKELIDANNSLLAEIEK
jgi:hypothetical protein